MEITFTHDNKAEAWRMDRLLRVYSKLTKKENIVGLHDWKGALIVTFLDEIHIETIDELKKAWEYENEYELIIKAI